MYGLCRWDLGHTEDIYCLYSPSTTQDILLSGGAGCTILIWDRKNGLCVGSLEPTGDGPRVGYTRRFASIHIDSKTQILLSAGGEVGGHTGRIWMWASKGSEWVDLGSAEVAAAGINSLLVLGIHVLAGDSKGNMDLFVAGQQDNGIHHSKD